MILNIILHVVSFIAGGVFSYLFLRANPKKAAAVGQAVSAVNAAASSVGTVMAAEAKKL